VHQRIVGSVKDIANIRKFYIMSKVGPAQWTSEEQILQILSKSTDKVSGGLLVKKILDNDGSRILDQIFMVFDTLSSFLGTSCVRT
jgi:hypothetical protein